MPDTDTTVAAPADAGASAEAKASEAIGQKMTDLGIPEAESEAPPEAKQATDEGGTQADEKKPDEAEAEAEEPPAEEAVAQELDPALRQSAKQLGLTDAEIAAMGDQAETVITAAANKLRRKMAEIGDRLERTRQAKPRGAEAKSEPSDAAPEPLTFSDDDLNPNDQGAYPLMGKLGKLSERMDGLETKFRENTEREVEATVDRFFDGLDKETYVRFGTGKLTDLVEDSPEARARIEVMDEAAKIRAGYAAVGDHISLSDSLAHGLAIVAADDVRAAERSKLTKQLKARADQQIGKPSGRQRSEGAKTPEQRAGEAIERRARELGVRLQED